MLQPVVSEHFTIIPEHLAKQGVSGQNMEKQNYDKSTFRLSRHSSFMIMHIFADWGNTGRIWKKALELLWFRLLRLKGRIGINANVLGEILSSNGLLSDGTHAKL